MEPYRVQARLERVCAAVLALHLHRVAIAIPRLLWPSIVTAPTETTGQLDGAGDPPTAEAHLNGKRPSDAYRASLAAARVSLVSAVGVNPTNEFGGGSVRAALTQTDTINAVDMFRSASLESTKSDGHDRFAALFRRTCRATRRAPAEVESNGSNRIRVNIAT